MASCQSPFLQDADDLFFGEPRSHERQGDHRFCNWNNLIKMIWWRGVADCHGRLDRFSNVKENSDFPNITKTMMALLLVFLAIVGAAFVALGVNGVRRSRKYRWQSEGGSGAERQSLAKGVEPLAPGRAQFESELLVERGRVAGTAVPDVGSHPDCTDKRTARRGPMIKGEPKSLLAGAAPHGHRALTAAQESEFYDRLCTALPEADIFKKVALKELVDAEHNDKLDIKLYNKKVFDFVVRGSDGGLLYAVELDDRSCAWQYTRRDDLLKDDVARAIGLRVMRYWSVKTDLTVLRRDFESCSARSFGRRN